MSIRSNVADARGRGRPSPLLITVAVVGALVALLLLTAQLVTEYLWFENLSMQTVFTTQWVAKLVLFFAFGILLGGMVFASMAIAYRLRPKVRRANLDADLLVQLRDVLDRRSAMLMLVPAVIIGLMGGGAAASSSEVFLAWWKGSSFGVTDAHFGLDVSFFVFTLPALQFLVSFVLFALVLSAIAALSVHFMTGSLTTQAVRGLGNVPSKSTLTAQRHISIMLGLGLVVFAVNSYLTRFLYSVTTNQLLTGITYTDSAARVPAQTILAAVALLCAALCFYNAYKVRWSIPAVSLALMVVTGIILTMVYPWFIQNFQVEPNKPERERPFIAANLEATQKAYGIDNIDIDDYEAVTSVSAGQLRSDAEALPAIRLMDPSVMPPTFEQLQQVRGYYRFPKTLDVDRYEIDGRSVDMVVAVRELDLASVESGELWNNMRTVYTHGHGIVAAYGNQRQVNGEPVFASGGIPTVGLLDEHQSRIYFGERSTHWVVAGAPEGSTPVELDTPSGGEARTESRNTYDGEGGVAIGNPFMRALFALRFGDINLMLSDRVNEESQLLFNRVPMERVQEVAPWLTLDSDPYPSVVNGKIVWIIDGYTTTNSYPNSWRSDWENSISDSRTQSAQQLTMAQKVNYVRNSVKATVDAYDGTVTLYEWDEEDPILQTWSKVFPGVITPKEKISPELLEHLRYPQDMFKLQRQILSRYHTKNTDTWLQESDVWAIPNDPVRGGTQDAVKQPPYFLTIRWPGDDEPHYANTTVFVPRERENLSVFMAANADATSENYGQLRALKLSDTHQISGPGQTFNAISTNEQVADRLLPFTRQGSTASAIYGNLLTLPVGGGLLYVQPIYTQTTSTTGGYPALRFVVVRFGEHVGIGETLQAALDQVFKGDAGADTGEGSQEEVPGLEPDSGTEQPALETSVRVRNHLDSAEKLFAEADAALREGKLADYQAKNDAAKVQIESAIKLLDEETGVAETEDPSASEQPSGEETPEEER
ncbi:UPF0182 family membrane protein [Tessaracoccus caeni]|uniref:UPF0182 family membrane protein n=1 Tax=Tessaracoccus caeni TaxID=3031239 RepID=UPI0023DAC8E1|nr:UPF0182 family protein [Tessaracoccus caeni]MDF1486785.1 UPF0182 family protein [Tessaracoccus caeni]